MPVPIEGSTVVLTGASSGIGRAAAVAFARRGANVVVAARSARSLDEVAAECDAAGEVRPARRGRRTLAVPTDVADEASVERLAGAAEDRFGGFDTWVNAAGVIAYGRFEDTPADLYRAVVDTNLFGQIHGARAAIPRFRRRGGGVLVNVASVWGSVTSPYVSPYVVSKFAVRAFSECLQEGLRLDPSDHRIHVCTILPQSVDTPIFRHAANFADQGVRPIPPTADPARAARAIVRSATHPRRQRTVGWSGRALEVGHALLPGVYLRLVPPVMRAGAFTREPSEPTPGNVFEPMADWNRVSGHWRRAGALRQRVVEAVLRDG